MSIERLMALEKKWRAAGDAETKRADGDGLSDGEQGWHHGRGEQYDNCADELATLIAELGQEVGAVAWGVRSVHAERGDLWMCDFGLATIWKENAERYAAWANENRAEDGPFVVVGFHTSPAHTSEARDAQRLDWIERAVTEKAAVWLLPSSDHRFVQVRWSRGDIDNSPTAPNLREAIDAAMRQEGGK